MYRSALLACLVIVSAIPASYAQQTTNVRGTLTAFDGKQLSIKSRSGTDVVVELPETVNVSITQPFSLADVKEGMTLGVTTIKRQDGSLAAIDLRPIPATAPLGLSPYDLQPDSTMTNATFQGAAKVSDGNEITLDYKSGSVKVLVLPETAMSRAAPGSRDDLKPGEAIYVAARPNAEGKLSAIRVQVGKDGLKPTQ